MSDVKITVVVALAMMVVIVLWQLWRPYKYDYRWYPQDQPDPLPEVPVSPIGEQPAVPDGLPVFGPPTNELPDKVACVQLVQAFPAAVESGLTIPPAYVGYTDADDAWIRRNWANNMTGQIRQFVWRLSIFIELCNAKHVDVVLRLDLAPGSFLTNMPPDSSIRTRNILADTMIEGVRF